MAIDLNSLETRQTYDPQNMLACVENFLDQCREGETLARNFELPRFEGIEQVVICGMGGSAIGGDILRAYVSRESTVPIEVVRNYSLPHYVGPKTLVVASSYSGNTEETLSAYQEAIKRSANIVAITTGGKLMEQCQKNGNPYLTIPAGYSPRAALGYSFFPLLLFMEQWGFIKDQSPSMKSLKTTLQETIQNNRYEVPESENPAKQLARKLLGTIPIIYAGEGPFQPVAARWRAQCNENAKVFARDFSIPEMNHNEILGWNHPSSVLNHFHIVFLLDKGYHSQVQKRFEVMEPILSPAAQEISKVQSFGSTLLARLFSLLYLGDYVSVYLAYLNQQDPTPIPAIDQLKNALET